MKQIKKITFSFNLFNAMEYKKKNHDNKSLPYIVSVFLQTNNKIKHQKLLNAHGFNFIRMGIYSKILILLCSNMFFRFKKHSINLWRNYMVNYLGENGSMITLRIHFLHGKIHNHSRNNQKRRDISNHIHNHNTVRL